MGLTISLEFQASSKPHHQLEHRTSEIHPIPINAPQPEIFNEFIPELFSVLRPILIMRNRPYELPAVESSQNVPIGQSRVFDIWVSDLIVEPFEV